MIIYETKFDHGEEGPRNPTRRSLEARLEKTELMGTFVL
jgi:hypothetical protein